MKLEWNSELRMRRIVGIAGSGMGLLLIFLFNWKGRVNSQQKITENNMHVNEFRNKRVCFDSNLAL
jgi:hypothetical protein